MTASRVCHTLRFFGVYNGPVMLSESSITRNREGFVNIICKSPDPEIYFITDGSEPTPKSNRFTQLFSMKNKGEVKAVVYTSKDKKSSNVSIARFGICKDKWKVIQATSSLNKNYDAEKALDDNPGSAWHTPGIDNQEKYPYTITVDMGETLNAIGFTYLPGNLKQSGFTGSKFQKHSKMQAFPV